ncbi:glycoside hydrolase family 29 protein, partial [Moniliophthora roreri]
LLLRIYNRSLFDTSTVSFPDESTDHGRRGRRLLMFSSPPLGGSKTIMQNVSGVVVKRAGLEPLGMLTSWDPWNQKLYRGIS